MLDRSLERKEGIGPEGSEPPADPRVLERA